MKLFKPVFLLLGLLTPALAEDAGIEARITSALSSLGYAQIQIGVSEGSVSASAVRRGRTAPSCFDLIGNRLVERRCRPPGPSADIEARGDGMQEAYSDSSGVEVEDLVPDTSTDEGPDVIETSM